MFKSALMIATSIAVGAGTVQLLHAAGSPPAYFIAMVNVKDQDGYVKDFLPKIQQAMKETGGDYVAGHERIPGIHTHPHRPAHHDVGPGRGLDDHP